MKIKKFFESMLNALLTRRLKKAISETDYVVTQENYGKIESAHRRLGSLLKKDLSQIDSLLVEQAKTIWSGTGYALSST